MILVSTGAAQAVRYTPPWFADQADAPVFLLRAGTVMERELMEAELAGECRAGAVWPWELQEAVIDGLRALAGDDAETLIALAEADRVDGIESEAEKATLAQALDVLGAHWPRYRALVAQMERRRQLFPYIAFRRFCCGWENLSVQFSRDHQGFVSDEACSQIDTLSLIAAGRQAYTLQFPGGAEEKNFDAPSKSADTPEISNSGATSMKAGKSRGKSTPKTRG